MVRAACDPKRSLRPQVAGFKNGNALTSVKVVKFKRMPSSRRRSARLAAGFLPRIQVHYRVGAGLELRRVQTIRTPAPQIITTVDTIAATTPLVAGVATEKL